MEENSTNSSYFDIGSAGRFSLPTSSSYSISQTVTHQPPAPQNSNGGGGFIEYISHPWTWKIIAFFLTVVIGLIIFIYQSKIGELTQRIERLESNSNSVASTDQLKQLNERVLFLEGKLENTEKRATDRIDRLYNERNTKAQEKQDQ